MADRRGTIPGIRFYQVKSRKEKKKRKGILPLEEIYTRDIRRHSSALHRPGTEGELVSPLGIDLEEKKRASLSYLRFRLRASIIQRSTTPEPSSEIRRWDRKRVHLPPEFFLFRHRHLSFPAPIRRSNTPILVSSCVLFSLRERRRSSSSHEICPAEKKIHIGLVENL